jgi:hypothetical protein
MKNKFTLLIMLLPISIFSYSQQIENPGFENWEEVGLGPDIIEPVDWSTIKTSDNPSISSLAPITWERSTDAHSGQYSVRLHNTSTLGIPVPGTMSNGQYHPNLNTELAWVFTNTSDTTWNTGFTARPDSIVFWMKFFPEGNDTLQFQALLHVDDATLPPQPENLPNQVAYTRADIGGLHENWTRVALAFNYYDNRTPEYILIIITSGNGTTPNPGSVAYYDDLEVIGGGQSIPDNPLSQVNIYSAGKILYLNNLPKNLIKHSSLEVLDLLGRTIWQSTIQSDKIPIDPTFHLKGIYIVKISSADYVLSKKVNFK